MFSTRKRLLKAKFAPGILTRARGRKPGLVIKRQRRCMDAYLLECLRRVLPQKKIQACASMSRVGLGALDRFFISRLEKLLRALGSARLESAPDEGQTELFKTWVRGYGRDLYRRERCEHSDLHSKLQLLGIHSAYVEAVADDHTRLEEELHEQWQLRVAAHKCRVGGWAKQRRFPRFIGLLEDLYTMSGVRDTALCGKLELDRAAEYCATESGKGLAPHMDIPRAELLGLTGFEHSKEELRARTARVGACLAHFRALSKRAAPLTSTHYLMLRRCLATDPAQAATMPIEQLKERLESFDAKVMCKGMVQVSAVQLFALLEIELRDQGMEEKCAELRGIISLKCFAGNSFAHFCQRSEWHAKTLAHIRDAFAATSYRSAYAAYERQTESNIATCALYISRYAEAEHGAVIPEAHEPFRWFLENSTPAMVFAMTKRYLQDATLARRPERIKASNDGHSADQRAGKMIRFLKVGLAEILSPEHLGVLNVKKLLRQVENAREPADPMTRRTFTEEEIDGMLTTSREDPKMHLLIVLLSEVGLRLSALANLKYCDLVDARDTPRHICNVLEKGRSRRSFVTSDQLKEAVAASSVRLRAVSTELGHTKIYVFNELRPLVPVAVNTIGNWVRKIAARADVTGVKVHPHAFRHTIVGRLMDAGNSLEVVSKYMGHKSVDTTSSHYWVATVQELHDNLNNPMTGSYQDKDRDRDLVDLELQVLCQKKAKAMDVIGVALELLAKVARAGGSAAEVASELNEALPNLGQILEVIGE